MYDVSVRDLRIEVTHPLSQGTVHYVRERGTGRLFRIHRDLVHECPISPAGALVDVRPNVRDKLLAFVLLHEVAHAEDN